MHFKDYIESCKTRITKVHQNQTDTAITANLPFELPAKNHTKKIGALMIHGLFDCPFTMRELAETLSENNILSRAILLPGHGLAPDALLDVTYQDWINTVKEHTDAFSKEVDEIILIGFSTGAALAIHEAITNERIKAIVLLAPAIRINETIDMFVGWRHITHLFSKKQKWLYRRQENDYCKYQSVALNAIAQVSMLTEYIAKLCKQKKITQTILMALSREDETISSHMAMDFFHAQKNPENRLILYSAHPNTRAMNQKIIMRSGAFSELHIKHLSHASIMFSKANKHYGQSGDYIHASRIHQKKTIYGAYHALERKIFDYLFTLKLVRSRRRALTYNPDFDFLAKTITDFCLSVLTPKDKS